MQGNLQKLDLVTEEGDLPLHLGKKSKMIKTYTHKVTLVDIMMLT